MKKRTLALLMGLAGLGSGLWASQPVSANSQYSAQRSNAVRLIWRRGMNRYAYTATRGARYSKHLGIRYSNNDVTPNVVWYTDAHEKLYNKYKRKSAIYYHVKSADGTLSGWIWRGYLTTAKTAGTTTTSNTTTQKPAATDQLANTIIKNMTSGAKPDATTMAQAKTVLTQMVGPTYHFSRKVNLTPGWWYGTMAQWTGDDSDRLQFKQLLAASNLTYGFGYDKTISTAVIGTKDEVLNGLYWQMWVEDQAFDGSGTFGVTESNFYVPAKIGVATKQLADGRYAMFSIVRLPANYGKIALYDE